MSQGMSQQKEMEEDIAVRKFREYLRIHTEQPNPDYESCTKFLCGLADELQLERSTYECVKGKPFVIMTCRGEKPDLPSLMLYSHTDVVPVVREMWKHDPFEAFKDSDGRIYGRGTQDMKSVGIQYVEALRRLQKRGKKSFLRTIHVVFAPDEEIGGVDGMRKFVETEAFRELNVGFTLDEGAASPDETYRVYYGERCPWWVQVKCRGQPGHGSLFIEDTAAEKLQRVINSFLAFRAEQKKIFDSDPEQSVGKMITVNLTKIEGGSQVNVVPTELTAYFDVRLPPWTNFEEFEAKIKRWCEEAGRDVSYSFLMNTRIHNTTPITEDDPWWRAFSAALAEENCPVKTEIFLGSTDSRYLRQKGHRSLGFTPMIGTKITAHDHNEYLDESVFLRGVRIYERLIEKLAAVV